MAEWCHFGKQQANSRRVRGDADRNVKFEHQKIRVVEDLTMRSDLVVCPVFFSVPFFSVTVGSLVKSLK